MSLHKALNALRRRLAGLPARGAAAPVSPEVRNDLYMAHLAVYAFAAGLVEEGQVLDLGCGTGYGADRLARAGASRVVGVDPDERCLAYARRHWLSHTGPNTRPGLRFVSGAAEDLGGDLGLFDLVVAANLFPHVASPKTVLDSVVLRLAPGGALVASVPPVVDERTMEAHRASGLHRSNLYLWDWESLFRKRFKEIHLHRLVPPAGLDLSSPAPSRFGVEDFRIEEIPLADLNEAGSLAAIFVGLGPRV